MILVQLTALAVESVLAALCERDLSHYHQPHTGVAPEKEYFEHLRETIATQRHSDQDR